MPRDDYKRCKECGRHVDEVGPLSHTRLCMEDANRLRNETSLQMRDHRGPRFQAWRRGMAAAVGGVLLDHSPID